MFRGDSGEHLRVDTARRPELRRPPARLSGHHRVDQHRPRRLVRAGTTRSGARRRRRSGSVHDDAVRRRRDRPLAAAAAVDLPLVRRPLRGGLEPPRAAGRAAATRSGFYVSGDYQFARRWFAGGRFDRSERADDASLRDNGAVGAADVLAERVQPGARPVPADELRRRPDRERVPVPVPVLDRRARRASVLVVEVRIESGRSVVSEEVMKKIVALPVSLLADRGRGRLGRRAS